ncbi:MAG: DUF3299 domain-containing protein [Pseudomonadota bacterium]
MSRPITRRDLMAGSATALALGGGVARAEPGSTPGSLDVEWDDLAFGSDGLIGKALTESLTDLMGHDTAQALGLFDQPMWGEVNPALDGRRLRLPGYMVPLAYDGLGVTDFLLVPYIGACIHVPPPPPNQIVLVTTPQPYEVGGFFEAIYITGTMQTTPESTALAEVGYFMQGAVVTPYDA